MPTVAETIREISRDHLLNHNGVILGQCLRAVGWVGGTVPELREEDGIIELPTSDSSNGGIAVGMALANRRPIYVIRYQGFLWYNAASLVNYAAKSKELWNTPCPMFIRGIAMEGGMGPVAGNMHHSMVMRMPGTSVIAPMTPNEWREGWDYFMSHDEPVFCSEHRQSFGIDYEIPDEIHGDAKITVFAISYARINARKAITDTITNFINLVWLKPFSVTDDALAALQRTGKGLVIDCEHTTCGAAEHFACQLMYLTGAKVKVLGLADRTAGFSALTDNLTPTPETIRKEIEALLEA